jgi:hypothetical protein
VTTNHVDDVAARYCTALAEVGQSATRQAIRTQVVTALAARLIGERFAADRGVSPDASYQSSLGQLKSQIGQFDESTQDAILEVEGSQYYVTALLKSAGQQSFSQWLGHQHVEVNPVYGMKVDGERFAHVDASLSVAASRTAKSAVKSAADPSSAAEAGSSTCG